MTSLLWLTLRTFLPVVILIILLQLWSLKSDYQIGEPHKWHSWSSVCVWNVNVQGIKWKLIWRTLFPLTKTQKRKWANTLYQAIMTSRLVNNTYVWQNYKQYVRPLFKEIKKWWHLPRSICIKEQAPLLNSTFRQILINLFIIFQMCKWFLQWSLWRRTALKWSVIGIWYGQTSLIRRPKGQNQVSALQRCPYYRVRESMIFAFLGPNELSVKERCPHHRGVRKERLHWISFFSVTGKKICQ